MTMKAYLVVCLIVGYTNSFGNCYGLSEEFTWSRITFAKPQVGEETDSVFAEDGRGNAIITEDYIYENNIPQGANLWRNKLFITVPRRVQAGVPSTLNFVWTNCTERHNVPLIPYPSYEANRMQVRPTPDHLVSVYRIAIDPCDRLWMADTGVVDTLGNKTQIQPQRVVVIDLNTDRIIRVHNFKPGDLTERTVINLVTVDVTSETCDDAYAYFPDLGGYGMLVYSLKNDDSWRVEHNYFHLEPLRGEFCIAGLQFQWNDGVFSLALSDIKLDGFRDLYFHSMAGTNLYKVSTRVLRDKQLATRTFHGNDFIFLGDRGGGFQTSATDLHKPSGVLFLNLVNRNAVGCWNTRTPLTRENIGLVHKDDARMIYAADLKIARDNLIVLTNSMPVFLYSTLDYDQVNFRVWANKIEYAIAGTACSDVYF